MVPSFQKLIDNATDTLAIGVDPNGGDEIVAVVPSQASAAVKPVDVASGAAVQFLGLMGTPLAVLPFLRIKIGQYRSRNAGAIEQSKYGALMLVFRRSRLDIHRFVGRGRPGDFIESFRYDEVESFGRKPEGMAVETWLNFVEGGELLIHGWYERDLRRAIEPLGIHLIAIPGATAQITRTNPTTSPNAAAANRRSGTQAP